MSFQILQKNAKARKNLELYKFLFGNLVLTNKKTLKDWFCFEMVSHRAINYIIQTL